MANVTLIIYDQKRSTLDRKVFGVWRGQVHGRTSNHTAYYDPNEQTSMIIDRFAAEHGKWPCWPCVEAWYASEDAPAVPWNREHQCRGQYDCIAH